VAFDRKDEALPMPLDPKAEPVLDFVPITSDLNVYILTIAGLPAGKYGVAIDGETAATVSADDLAGGWNFAYKGGPITRQAGEVLTLVAEKNNAYFKRWRDVQLYWLPKWAEDPAAFEQHRTAELQRLDGEIAGLEAKIDDARQPRVHHFVIKPSATPE